MLDLRQSYIFTHGKKKTSRSEKVIVMTVLLAFFAINFWLFYWDLLNFADLLKKVKESPKFWQGFSPIFLPFCLLLLVQIGSTLVYRSTRLVVNDTGLFLEWPADSMFAKFSFLTKKINWVDLKNVTYLSGFEILQLRSKTGKLPWAIKLKTWTLSRDASSPVRTVDGKTDLLSILQQYEQFGGAPKDDNLAAFHFDLMKHPATRKVLIMFAALVVYCFADSILQSEGWAFFNKDYLRPHLIIAACATALLAWVLYKAGESEHIPGRIIMTLVMLTGFSFATTSYVAGTRINQLVGSPLITANYHRDDSCEKLIPEDKNLPPVEYTKKTKAYWCSIAKEDVVKVQVRKGLFGKFQFDLREHTRAIREFMQKL